MRLLLTQSQVSVALSSSVVVFFTLLLFLSGYVLQQRTVKGLQDAVRPRIPQRAPGSDAQEPEIVELSRSRLFGENGGERIVRTDFDREVHSLAAGQSLDWNRLAHIQLVRNHHDVCSAIMVLAELHKQKSPARRVLLFPKAWAEQKKAEKGETEDPYVQSTRRLMRLAARRYHVELHPIAPIKTAKDKDGEDVDTYSLASVYALQHDFDRLLTIETPGMLLDAEPLDAILGFTEAAPFVMLHDTVKNDNVHSEDMLLLQPSKTLYKTLIKTLEEDAYSGFNDTYLSSLFPKPVLLASSSESSALIRSVGTLHHASHDFNQTAYLDNVAYIRFSDPKLPGPEYDVPWADKVAARPKNKDADWTWTKLYGEFAQMRMDICGLDLESWRP
ncbi:hypothetical protein AC579_4853 [Pseudocercospora musae]|uniref:Glycosyltransferase family 8 protein n=1 Tax=Pseudocercospora musae TaxID=113226 RepID=A0A139IKK1_9PEZI|nr:hypothetical protein AC579_4853 [Pseudocercospora musae]